MRTFALPPRAQRLPRRERRIFGRSCQLRILLLLSPVLLVLPMLALIRQRWRTSRDGLSGGSGIASSLSGGDKSLELEALVSMEEASNVASDASAAESAHVAPGTLDSTLDGARSFGVCGRCWPLLELWWR